MINGLTVTKAINFLGQTLCLFRNKSVRFTVATFPRSCYIQEGSREPTRVELRTTKSKILPKKF